MDLVQTGKFIAALRKEHGLTQEQLGEIIGVSNKTVSRWETGTYLPPAESLLEMSNMFGVSVNELLSGKRLSEGEYRSAAEQNLAQAIGSDSFSYKDRLKYYKKKWLREHIAIMCFWGICIIGTFAAGILSKKYLLTFAAVLLLVAGHAWRNNTMMAYAERNTYGNTGRQ